MFNKNLKNQLTIFPKLITQISLYSVVITIALLIYGYKFPSSNNLIEVPPVMALLNPELFKNDYYIQDTLKITPRYYYQYLTYLTTSWLGIDLYKTYFIFYLISFASFILGLYALGKRFTQSQLGASVLVFLGLTVFEGTVGYVSLFRSEPIPAVLAMGFTVWGFYFCFCQRWNLGYFLFGCACMVQFLIGILPGMLMIPILVLQAYQEHKYTKIIAPLVILGIFASLIYLPMSLSGNTGSDLISDRQFVYFYGHIRQPHHILPSQFPATNWRNFIALILSGLLLIKTSCSLKKEDQNNLIIVIGGSLILLLIGYIFVEIYPVALVAKLQFARTTPFASLMALIAIAVIINEQYKNNYLALCVLLLATPINKNGMLILLMVVLGFLIFKGSNNLKYLGHPTIKIFAIVSSLGFLLIYPLPQSLTEAVTDLGFKILLLLVVLLPLLLDFFKEKIEQYWILITGVAIANILIFVSGLSGLKPQSITNFFQSRIGNIDSQQFNQDFLTKMALRFKNQTDVDALILTPPSFTKFRFYSQRAVVYTFYSSPYSDQGISEWASRLKTIFGDVKAPISLTDLDRKYEYISSTDLVRIAKQFKAQYILTNLDWHFDLKAEILIQDGKWVIYKID